MKKRYCKCGCGHVVVGHPNKKFFNRKHKDRHHNRINPRGHFAHLNHTSKSNRFEMVGQKVDEIEDTMHPQDTYSLGQE